MEGTFAKNGRNQIPKGNIKLSSNKEKRKKATQEMLEKSMKLE